MTWLPFNIRVKGALTQPILSEVHGVEVKKSWSLGSGLSAIVGLGITALTLGAGAPVATAIGMTGNSVAIATSQAAVSALSTQMALGTINNQGDVGRALQGMTSRDGLMSLGTSMLSAGILDKLQVVTPGINATFDQVVDYSAKKVLVNSGINVTIGQHNIDDVLKNAGVNFVTDVVGTVGANYIGELYQAGRGRIDFATPCCKKFVTFLDCVKS